MGPGRRESTNGQTRDSLDKPDVGLSDDYVAPPGVDLIQLEGIRRLWHTIRRQNTQFEGRVLPILVPRCG